MTFVVRRSKDRQWPVTVLLNVCDKGGVVTPIEQTFVGYFKPFTEAEHAAIVAEIDSAFPKPAEGEALAREKILQRNAAYFNKLVTGWGAEVTDEAGAPLAFSPEALTQMATGPDGFPIGEALFRAIAEIRYGGAPLKNLTTSVAPGDLSSVAGGATTSTEQT